MDGRKKILVIGSGGRTHALAWKLAQSGYVEKVYVAPGNGGTLIEGYVENIPIGIPTNGNDFEVLARFVTDNSVDITIVGPEAPLADGIVDYFRVRGLKIFGPNQAAAQLESSKSFAKHFMIRNNIPTAKYVTFKDAKVAHAYVNARPMPIVIKADWLAAGKGVVVAMTSKVAHAAIDKLFATKLGDPNAKLVLEEFLEGEEASYIVMVDHNGHVLPLATSQDHKPLLDGDQGPMTGGMGAYSPAPIITEALERRILDEIVYPTVEGMRIDGILFTGFLYAGLMIDKEGNPRTLEFNVRMGDPETQPIMLRLKSDLFEIITHAVNGTLDRVIATWDPRPALGVVLAAEGYPDAPKTGGKITGLPIQPIEDCKVFHAGTKEDKDNGKLKIVVDGGRVLCVTALGSTLLEARQLAYKVAKGICFDGKQFRTDIGHRALKTLKASG